jgi:hypothetical protein
MARPHSPAMLSGRKFPQRSDTRLVREFRDKVGRPQLAAAIEAYRKHSSFRRWHRVGGRAAGGPFLAMRLVVLPHCVTRQESFVLLCQLAQGGEQLPRLELEARQLPQTRNAMVQKVYLGKPSPRMEARLRKCRQHTKW